MVSSKKIYICKNPSFWGNVPLRILNRGKPRPPGVGAHALFHPKGPQGSLCAQGALPSVQRDPVAHSGAVGNQGPL